ncbi:SpoIIE family protein phosphatase [Rhodospirillum sp. A1_3_36]|uniref:SpoIIE family protein phosphatase n=1 Tax=Rhodospirillum sp. A1_3_36 TaxID=3391666 RepID=UPI0039A5A824
MGGVNTATGDETETKSVFRRYRSIMALTYLLSLVIAVGLSGWLYVINLDSRLDRIAIDVREHKVTLDRIVESSVNFVSGMRLFSENWLRHTSGRLAGDAPLYRALRASEANGFLTLDQLPPGISRDEVGNLTAPWPLVRNEDAFQQEVGMALALNPMFRIIKNAIPNAAWVYYTSESKFINIFPYVESKDFRFTEDLYTHGFYKQGLPKNNPERRQFWSEAYMDEAGKGLMVSLAAPIYREDDFLGTVALDLTLSELNKYISELNYGLGEGFIVNDLSQLLAHPSGDGERVGEVLTGDQGLPFELRGRYEEILAADYTGGYQLFDGYYVFLASMDKAPWRLGYVVPKGVVNAEILWLILPEGVYLLLSLTAMLLVANYLTRKDFIDPSQALVRFIDRRSSGGRVALPQVPDGWRPWIEKVDSAFDSHGQIIALRQELETAHTIQHSALTTDFPDTGQVMMHGMMRAAKTVGGDFYDVIPLGGDRYGIVMADVSGKGIPAALFMMVSRTILRTIAVSGDHPSACLALVNDQLATNNEGSMFVTLFYGVYDASSGQLIYANGGHNPPVVLRADGGTEALPGTGGMALGIMEGLPFAEKTWDLEVGGGLFLYTDGVTEAVDPTLAEYGFDRLLDLLKGRTDRSPTELCTLVVEDIDRFAGTEPQADDITCLALSRKA